MSFFFYFSAGPNLANIILVFFSLVNKYTCTCTAASFPLKIPVFCCSLYEENLFVGPEFIGWQRHFEALNWPEEQQICMCILHRNIQMNSVNGRNAMQFLYFVFMLRSLNFQKYLQQASDFCWLLCGLTSSIHSKFFYISTTFRNSIF